VGQVAGEPSSRLQPLESAAGVFRFRSLGWQIVLSNVTIALG